MHTLDEIIASPAVRASPGRRAARLAGRATGTPQGPDSDACKADAAYREAFGAAVTKTMDDVEAGCVRLSDVELPAAARSATDQQARRQQPGLSPTSGFPAINVPMGFTRDDTLPAGMTILGRAWDEATLIQLAYAYEQATHQRHPPTLK